MIRAAIVGIGWWGRMLVNAVQSKSAAIRFTAGYTRTRATAEGFCANAGITRSRQLISERIRLLHVHRTKLEQIKCLIICTKPLLSK